MPVVVVEVTMPSERLWSSAEVGQTATHDQEQATVSGLLQRTVLDVHSPVALAHSLVIAVP
jgi:hypothetical protein